jgi:hypothetical protein
LLVVDFLMPKAKGNPAGRFASSTTESATSNPQAQNDVYQFCLWSAATAKYRFQSGFRAYHP